MRCRNCGNCEFITRGGQGANDAQLAKLMFARILYSIATANKID